MEALTVGYRSNEYASGSYIGKQEIEGPTGWSLFSQQRTVKRTDKLTKEKQEEKYEVWGTVQNSSNQS
jgi:hypothetical protein